jgi:mannose-1-phosphate guanylyltransferase
MKSNPWAVILAGGDGTRLKELSRLISGDNRPKQFCALFGGGSLLARTRGRLAPAIPPDRMLFVVVKDHERFYLPELAGVDRSRIVVQPANRGTTPAIVYSLLRLTRLEGDPVAALFPADHHYADETQFTRAVNAAFEVVNQHPEMLVLLGARAENAAVEYGWIEPGPPLDAVRTAGKWPVFRVNRFWEKPTTGLAHKLLGQGCLWNTFVVVGRALTFLEVLQSRLPETLKAFQPIANARAKEEEDERAGALYETLPSGDFSSEVLTECPEKLAVLRMDDAGWGDLGTPEGVVAAIQQIASTAAKPDPFTAWMARYCRQLEGVRQRAPDNDAERAH